MQIQRVRILVMSDCDKVTDSQIQVHKPPSEVEGRPTLGDPIRPPSEMPCDQVPADIIREVPSFDTGIISVTGKMELSHPAALAEIADLRRIECPVC